jgi:hypothetical protein
MLTSIGASHRAPRLFWPRLSAACPRTHGSSTLPARPLARLRLPVHCAPLEMAPLFAPRSRWPRSLRPARDGPALCAPLEMAPLFAPRSRLARSIVPASRGACRDGHVWRRTPARRASRRSRTPRVPPTLSWRLSLRLVHRGLRTADGRGRSPPQCLRTACSRPLFRGTLTAIGPRAFVIIPTA